MAKSRHHRVRPPSKPRPFILELPRIFANGKKNQDPAAVLKKRGWDEEFVRGSWMFRHPAVLDGAFMDWEFALRAEGIR